MQKKASVCSIEDDHYPCLREQTKLATILLKMEWHQTVYVGRQA
jgi:hypothetical protein